jgi:hypothetical protein
VHQQRALDQLRLHPDRQAAAQRRPDGSLDYMLVRDAPGRRELWEQWGWTTEDASRGIFRARVRSSVVSSD